MDTYAKALRRIAAGVMGISGDSGKFDSHQGGNKRWRDRVNAVRLDELTPSKVAGWKKAFIESADTPKEREKAITTAKLVAEEFEGAVVKEDAATIGL